MITHRLIPFSTYTYQYTVLAASSIITHLLRSLHTHTNTQYLWRSLLYRHTHTHCVLYVHTSIRSTCCVLYYHTYTYYVLYVHTPIRSTYCVLYLTVLHTLSCTHTHTHTHIYCVLYIHTPTRSTYCVLCCSSL